MRLGCVAVLVATALVATSLDAAAQTAKQKNVLEHTARALAARDNCERVVLDDTRLALGLFAHGIKAEDFGNGGRWNSLFRAFYDDAESAYRSERNESIRCAVALSLYGPEGINVPKLLRRR